MKKVTIDARSAGFTKAGRGWTVKQAARELIESLQPGEMAQVVGLVNRWGEDSLTVHNVRQIVSNANKDLKADGSKAHGVITVRNGEDVFVYRLT